MLIGLKDVSKLVGISIISCCAVLVCTMFLNFYLDVSGIESEITSQISMVFYNAQVSTAKVVCMVSGGCLMITSVVMLMFYIKHYIDTHKKELGILKALGYSSLSVAKGFWVFGISALIGAAIGFVGAFVLMPRFYALQNKDKMLPEISIHFHPSVLLYFVILPTIGFSILAIGYAWCKLKSPVLSLLRNDYQTFVGTKTLRRVTTFNKSTTFDKATKYKDDNKPAHLFVDDLKRATLKGNKALTFFIIFASFCFSSMTQMSFSMKDLSSEMMGAMMLIIGLVLAFTTLFIAITTVIKGNSKTIAMMRAFGYSQKECTKSILGVYRPMSYIGFAIGTVYQYALLRIMVDIVFKDVNGVPVYKFDVLALLASLVVFAAAYEILMLIYSDRIKRISIKEIMAE